jgi:N-methylhydantoinase A
MDPGEGVTQVRRAIDLRYQGQAFELVVPLGEDVEDAATARQRFRDEYVRQYGHAQDQAEVEMTTLRVTVTQSIGKAPVAERMTGHSEPRPSFRPVFFGPKPVQCAIYSRDQLGAGFAADGPMVVEEYGATTVVPPSWRVTVRDSGVLDLEKRP